MTKQKRIISYSLQQRRINEERRETFKKIKELLIIDLMLLDFFYSLKKLSSRAVHDITFLKGIDERDRVCRIYFIKRNRMIFLFQGDYSLLCNQDGVLAHFNLKLQTSRKYLALFDVAQQWFSELWQKNLLFMRYYKRLFAVVIQIEELHFLIIPHHFFKPDNQLEILFT